MSNVHAWYFGGLLDKRKHDDGGQDAPKAKHVVTGFEQYAPIRITTEYNEKTWTKNDTIVFVNALNFLRQHGIDASDSYNITAIFNSPNRSLQQSIRECLELLSTFLHGKQWYFTLTTIALTPEYLRERMGVTIEQKQLFRNMIRFMCFYGIESSTSPTIGQIMNSNNEQLKNRLNEYLDMITELVYGNYWVIENCANVTQVGRG